MKGPEAQAIHEARRERRERIAAGGADCPNVEHGADDMVTQSFCGKCFEVVPRDPSRKSAGIKGVSATATADGQAI